MRTPVLLLALAGCSFDGAPGVPLVPDAAPEDMVVDARELDAPADSPDVSFCEESGVVACYQFEGSTLDGTANQLDATMENVSFAAGVQGLGLVVTAQSRVDVPDSVLFDVDALTIDAWIRPTEAPAPAQRAGIVDMEGQYGLFLHPGGRLECSGGGSSGEVEANVPLDVWTHVACTYDGVNRRIYVNGVSTYEGSGGAISTSGTAGIAVAGNNPNGARLIGMLDQVRVWSRAITPAEVCSAAGCP